MSYKKILQKNKLRNSILTTYHSKIKEKRIVNLFFSFGLHFLKTQKIHKNFQIFVKQNLNYLKKKNFNLLFLNNYLCNFFYILNFKNNNLKFNFIAGMDKIKILLLFFYNNIEVFGNKNNNKLFNAVIKNFSLFSIVTKNFIKMLKISNKKKMQVKKENIKHKLYLKYFYFKTSTFFGISKKVFKIKKKHLVKNNSIFLPNYLFKNKSFGILNKNVFEKNYKKKVQFVFPKIEIIKNKKNLKNKVLFTGLNFLNLKLKKTKAWYRKHQRYSKFQRKIILRKYKLKRKSKNFYKKLFFKKQNSHKTKFSKLFGFSKGDTVLLEKKNNKFQGIREKKINYNFMLDQQLFGVNLVSTKKKAIYNLQINSLVNNIFSEYLDIKKNYSENTKHINLLTFRHNFLFFVKNYFFFKKLEKNIKKNIVTPLKPGFLVINSYKNNLFASFLSNKKEVSVKLSLGLLKFNEKKYDFLSYVNVFRGLSFLLFYYGNIAKMIKTYQKTLKIGEIRINFIKRNVLRNKRKKKRIILQIFLVKYARYIKKVKKRFDRKIKKNKILSIFLNKNKKFRILLQKIFMKRVKNFLTENYRAKRQKRQRYKKYSYFESRMRFLVLMEIKMLKSEKKLAHNLRYGIVNPGFGFKKPEEIETSFDTEIAGQDDDKKKRKMKNSLADYRKKLYAIAERTSKQSLNVYRSYIKAKFKRPFFFRHMDLYRPKRIRMYNVKKEFKNDKLYKKIKTQQRKLSSLFKFKKLLTKKKRIKKRRMRKKKISVKNLQIFKLLNNKVQKKVLNVIYDFRKVLTKRSSLFSKYKILSKKQKTNLIYIGKYIFPKVWTKLSSRDDKIKRMVMEVKKHNRWINSFLKDITYGQGKPQTVEKIFADKAKYRLKYIARKKKRQKFRKRGFFQRKLKQVQSLKRKIFANLRKKKIFLQKFRRFTLNFIMSWGLFFFKKQLKMKLITKTLNYFQYNLRQFILIKSYLSQIKTKKYFIRIKMKYTGDLADLIYFNLARFFQTAQRKKWMKFYSKLIRIYFAKYKNVKRKKKLYLADYKI